MIRTLGYLNLSDMLCGMMQNTAIHLVEKKKSLQKLLIPYLVIKNLYYDFCFKAQDFMSKIKMQSMFYKGKNIIVVMGDDFNYQAAHINFGNMDKLINAVNRQQSNGSVINLFYSTPSCYLKALNNEQIQFPTKNDDFFPYSSDPHSFWSGYYTSRPTIKYFERIGNNFLQVCKQLYSVANLNFTNLIHLNKMRESMAIMQHHDAITGTEKQAVAFDYARILNNGFTECKNVTNNALRKLIMNLTSNVNVKNNAEMSFSLNLCLLLNISVCEITESNEKFVVTLYNPLSRPVKHYVRIPISQEWDYIVHDHKGQKLQTQIVPIHSSLFNIPERISKANFELIFIANNIPPLGFSSYHISKASTRQNSKQIVLETGFTYTIGHRKGGIININGSTGRMDIQLMDIPLEQNFWYYNSFSGNNGEFRNRSSGAYIFRPTNSDPEIINPLPKIRGFKGPLVEEIHQEFNEWTSQVIRVYKDADFMEFNWLIGPIPIEDKEGKEIISCFKFYNITSNNKFYTDSNGREMVERTLNFRPSYKVNLEEKVAGNYYPATTRVTIKDNNCTQYSVITDRAQGVTSRFDGQVELMFSALKSVLSNCIQILTLEPWKENSILLRLEHIAEKNDDIRCSKTITLNIEEIFKPFTILSIKETNLGSNQWIEDVTRLVWYKESNEMKDYVRHYSSVYNLPEISLNPMEIRTFIIEVIFN
uniref:Alpha-mannosidase n=1 Tax=Clastoptera arizonana TaxID=38151 RepID=A0A1B6CDC3_9HEMI